MSDLIQRWSNEAELWRPSPLTKLCEESIAALESQQAQIRELTEALQLIQRIAAEQKVYEHDALGVIDYYARKALHQERGDE